MYLEQLDVVHGAVVEVARELGSLRRVGVVRDDEQPAGGARPDELLVERELRCRERVVELPDELVVLDAEPANFAVEGRKHDAAYALRGERWNILGISYYK